MQRGHWGHWGWRGKREQGCAGCSDGGISVRGVAGKRAAARAGNQGFAWLRACPPAAPRLLALLGLPRLLGLRAGSEKPARVQCTQRLSKRPPRLPSKTTRLALRRVGCAGASAGGRSAPKSGVEKRGAKRAKERGGEGVPSPGIRGCVAGVWQGRRQRRRRCSCC